MAQYEYDAWGKHIRITDGSGNDVSDNPNHIANINPFRYRGYYFDVETGWYYLNARYYDPNVGRFISPDAILGANGGLQGYNLFAYCNNNPVMYIDPNGFASMAFYTGNFDPMRSLMQLRGSGAGMAIGILFATGLLITSKPYSGNSYVDDPIIPKPRYPFKQAAKEDDVALDTDIVKSKENTNNIKRTQYQIATLVGGNVVVGEYITFEEAKLIVSNGGNVMCANSLAAFGLTIGYKYKNY